MAETVVFVDDEESITNALKRLFRREGYDILTASSGQNGLDVLKESKKPVSLIISDQRMPEMSGAQFFEHAKKIFPDAIRILLTGYSDMDAIIDAINKGEIHRYLTKPWNDGEILLHVRHALEQYELEVENRQLEKSLFNIVRLLSSLVEALNPTLGTYMLQVARLAREVAKEYELEERDLDQIEMAGMIHDIGFLGLPEYILTKDEEDMSEKEFDLFRQHPAIGQSCLQSVENLDQVGAIVLSHHEHYDGSGFPNGLKGEEISLGARIIGVVADYCRVISLWPSDGDRSLEIAQKYLGKMAERSDNTEPKTITKQMAEKIILSGSAKKYDPDVVMKTLQKIESCEIEWEKKIEQVGFVKLEDLTPGMVLAKNMNTLAGKFLLAEGTTLDSRLILSIKRLGEMAMVEKHVYVIT